MNLLGYLITLANIQSFKKGGPIKDLSIKVAEIQTLYSDLIAIPGLDLEKFKDTGYYRYNDVGKYLSKNLREYMFNGSGNPKDEAIMLSLYFDADPNGRGLMNDEDDTLSLFLHKDIEDEERGQVQDYLDRRYSRDRRAINRFVTAPVSTN